MFEAGASADLANSLTAVGVSGNCRLGHFISECNTNGGVRSPSVSEGNRRIGSRQSGWPLGLGCLTSALTQPIANARARPEPGPFVEIQCSRRQTDRTSKRLS